MSTATRGPSPLIATRSSPIKRALLPTKTSNDKNLQQAQAQLAGAQATLASDKTSNQNSLRSAQAQLAGAQATLASDQTGNQKNAQQAQDQLAGAQATLASDKTSTQNSLRSAQAQLAGAQATVAADKTSNQKNLQQAQAQLAGAQATVAADKTGNQKNLQQAQAQLAGAQATVAADKTSNQKNLQDAQVALTGALATLASDKTGNRKNLQSAEAALQSALDGAASDKTSKQQTLQSAQNQLATAQASVAADKTSNLKNLQSAQAEVTAARTTLSEDKSQLSQDVADAAVGTTGGSPAYTYLPQVGQVIGRGQELFAIDGQPSTLLYGNVTTWRAFMPGMSPGRDVAALNANLDALGYGHGLRGDQFTAATEAAVLKFQRGHHMTPTGQLALGSVLFEPGQIEVNTVTPTIGSTPSTGAAVFQVTLTARQVQVALDASQQTEVAVGDQVSIVLPNNSTTPGVVSYVGTIATTPSGGGSPTIEVNITPSDPAATGNLDDLPVNVWITEQSVPNTLVVPVQALVALSGGGYALEVAPAHSRHYLEAVQVGLFDDATGNVQVSGAGVYVGQKIVVPNV